MEKKLVGVITKWTLDGDRIRGMATYHPEYQGVLITTSSVLRIYLLDDVRFAETKNSIYVLA